MQLLVKLYDFLVKQICWFFMKKHVFLYFVDIQVKNMSLKFLGIYQWLLISFTGFYGDDMTSMTSMGILLFSSGAP